MKVWFIVFVILSPSVKLLKNTVIEPIGSVAVTPQEIIKLFSTYPSPPPIVKTSWYQEKLDISTSISKNSLVAFKYLKSLGLVSPGSTKSAKNVNVLLIPDFIIFLQLFHL